MHPNIEGLQVGPSESLISLHADYILLTLTNPEKGIQHLLKYVDSFGNISCYKINWSKTELMFIGENRKISQSPFRVVDSYTSSLGLKIQKKYDSLLKLNFIESLDNLKKYIDF